MGIRIRKQPLRVRDILKENLLMKKIVFFLLVVVCFGCSNDTVSDIDCSVVNCLSPGITLEILSKTTREDLFLNGTYSIADLTIVNQTNNEVVDFNSITTNEFIKIYISTAVPSTELKDYKISIANAFEFTLKFEAEITDKNSCCPGVKINNLVIENATYEVDNEFGTYIILL